MPGKLSLKALLLCSLIAAQFTLSGQKLPLSESDPEKGEFNRLPPRAGYFAYESLEKAIEADPGKSERFISLNGAWKFHFSETGKSLTGNFYKTDFNDSGWDTAMVPGIKEVPGNKSPVVTLYRKKIRLKEDWAAKQVFISLGTVRHPFTLWVNGQKAGYAKNNFRETEFNISSYIQPGENLLALELQGCSKTGSNGCPDSVSVMGSNVFLYTRPRLHLWDITIKSRLNESYRNGLFEMDLQVENRMDSVRERFWGVLKEPVYSSANIKIQLVDKEGNKVLDFNENNTRRIRGGSKVSFHFKGEIRDVDTWSHEMPHLYRLDITLLNEAGQVLEVVSRKIGFRTAELENGRLLVNGKPVLLKAFDLKPPKVPATNRETMLQDVQQIKQGHFNAVQSLPYFNDPYWYELCDRYGIYVVEEGARGNKNSPSVIPELGEGFQVLKLGRQNVGLQLVDFLKSTIRINNKYVFRDLSNYYLQWEILVNGKTAEEGRVNELSLKPGEEAGYTLGYKTRFYPGNDYFLNLKIKTKEEEPMIPAGFAVAARQFRLSPYQYEASYEVDKGQIDVTDDFKTIVLNGYDFRIVFDKAARQISRYSYKGKELMSKGPELNFRELQAPEDSLQKLEDSLQENHAVWNTAFEKGNLLEYKITEDVNGNYYITFATAMLGGDARLFQKFRVDGRGSILVENVFVTMKGEYPDLPGFGTRFELPADYERIEWYGREPEQGNAVGIYSGLIDAQNDSDKTDVRWVRLVRKDGYGIMIRKETDLLNLTASMQGEGPVLLNVDLSQKWVPYKSYNFTYRIIPYAFSATAQ